VKVFTSIYKSTRRFGPSSKLEATKHFSTFVHRWHRYYYPPNRHKALSWVCLECHCTNQSTHLAISYHPCPYSL